MASFHRITIGSKCSLLAIIALVVVNCDHTRPWHSVHDIDDLYAYSGNGNGARTMASMESFQPSDHQIHLSSTTPVPAQGLEAILNLIANNIKTLSKPTNSQNTNSYNEDGHGKDYTDAIKSNNGVIRNRDQRDNEENIIKRNHKEIAEPDYQRQFRQTDSSISKSRLKKGLDEYLKKLTTAYTDRVSDNNDSDGDVEAVSEKLAKWRYNVDGKQFNGDKLESVKCNHQTQFYNNQQQLQHHQQKHHQLSKKALSLFAHWKPGYSKNRKFLDETGITDLRRNTGHTRLSSPTLRWG